MKRALRKDLPLTLLMADLDDFKIFNDVNGHILGDEALKSVGEIIRGSVRGEDVAARYGGEEFSIILPDTGPAGALMVADRVRRRVESYPFKVKPEAGTPLTLSIGMASFPEDAYSKEVLLKKADYALFMAKRQGRNRICQFGPEVAEMEGVSLEELLKRELSFGIVQALATAVDAKDPFTYHHSEMVARFATALGKKVGLSDEEVNQLRMAAIVHDVGKIGISDEVLNKEGQLTPEEWGIVKGHPMISYNILRHVPSLHPLLPAILYHHENYDGGGYPSGLRGEDIPLMGRILRLADAYHAMVSVRPYRPALTQERAWEELRKGLGRLYDPKLVEEFISALPR